MRGISAAQAKTPGLAGTIAVAMKTALMATEKTAAISLFEESELANMGVYPFLFVGQQDHLAGCPILCRQRASFEKRQNSAIFRYFTNFTFVYHSEHLVNFTKYWDR